MEAQASEGVPEQQSGTQRGGVPRSEPLVDLFVTPIDDRICPLAMNYSSCWKAITR